MTFTRIKTAKELTMKYVRAQLDRSRKGMIYVVEAETEAVKASMSTEPSSRRRLAFLEIGILTGRDAQVEWPKLKEGQ